MIRLLIAFFTVANFLTISNFALADGSISCTRGDVDWSSPFKSQKDFDRFLPKSFDFPPPEAQRFPWTKKDTAKRLNLSVRLPRNAFGLNWSLLDNGKLIANAGSGLVVRYKCSGGANDYKATLAASSESGEQALKPNLKEGIDFFEFGRTVNGTLEHCRTKNARAGKIKTLYKQLEKKLNGLDALEFKNGITSYWNLRKPKNCSTETINKVREDLTNLIAVYKPSGRKVSEAIAARFQSTFLTNYLWDQRSMEYLAAAPKEKVNLWTSPPPCPTRLYWWAWVPKDELFARHDDSVGKFLDGWPKSTIEYCQNEIWLVKEGNLTSPEYHEKFWERSLATFFFRKGDQSFFASAIIQQDLLTDKTGGKVFNNTLEEVCSFKLLDGDAVAISCPTLGTAVGVYEIEDYKKGIFKVFATSENMDILVTNLSVEEFKNKYPKLQ